MSRRTSQLLSDGKYLDCFRSALRRMALALNCPTQFCPRGWLSLEDEALKTKFDDKPPSSGKDDTYDKLLVRLRFDAPDPSASYDDDDAAENFFYGRFFFRKSQSPQRVRVESTLQETFVKWSHKGLHMPRYSPEDMGVSQTRAPGSKFIASCAANYLLKNFWHNYVHNVLQCITFENYKRFGGDARYEADFEADNLANLFLVHSYGLPVCALGIEDHDVRRKILHLLRRNRCNKVFVFRSTARHQEPNQEDLEWRYRRTLSSYLSGWAAALGFAVTSLGVYLRPGDVIVSLNGIRLAVGVPPYLGEDANLRHRHFQNVALVAGTAYSREIEVNPNLQLYASQSLLACFTRAGLESVEEVMLPFEERPGEVRVQII
jgi:hypothetical protein